MLTTAGEQAAMIRAGDITCVELTKAHIAQIEKSNEAHNAIVTTTFEQALDTAMLADLQLSTGAETGPLHGLSVAHKDLAETKDVLTTFGSLARENFIPKENSLIVERIHTAGAIMLGKTNTPEYGAGSHTFNKLFGATCNPYDRTKSCGGSSGGAAVALATGMLSLADGSDMGGSLRNPAAWCNVVGFRPTPGRVPTWPTHKPLATLPVEGPMARTVEDVALFMQAIVGPDSRCPLSEKIEPQDFSKTLEKSFQGTRIALCPDFNKTLPVEPEICQVVENSKSTFASMGAMISNDLPDLSLSQNAFLTLRAQFYAEKLAPELDQYRDVYKETLTWNIEQGIALDEMQISRAEQELEQTRVIVNRFLEQYDFLILPVTQVSPFDINTEYPISINDTKMDTYLDWMKSCYYITVPGHPAISVPAGFDSNGLPVGLQIVGRYGDDFGVLQLAYAFQQETQYWKQHPLEVN